jgi:hypothetical protein
MDEKETDSELWKRKFKPITDWKPAGGTSGSSSGPRALFEEALEEFGKGRDALAKRLEPFGEEAKIKIKDTIKVLDDVASKSSTEARSFLSRLLSATAEKIKPKE